VEMKNWVENLAERFIETGIATPEKILGCTDEEVLEIEKFYNLKLPDAYKEYLLKFGKRSGDFLRECEIYYPHILENREAAETLLDANTDYKLKQSDYVFIARYGCQFWFFQTEDRNPNPPVLRYTEDSLKPILLAESFTAAIEMVANEYFEREKNPLLNEDSKFFD